MKIQQIQELTDAVVACGNDKLDHDVQCAFASDLMSDVLTLDCNEVILITGLCNLQTIRTAEMADVDCILFVRGKRITPEMLQLASENNMILLETEHSMYHTVGELYYVTPCAAKIAALKSTDGYSSTINGVINMDTLYNKVYHILQNRPKGYKPECVLPPALTKKEMRWSQTGGEAKHFSGRCLAIDEIHNVIDFLERMEATTEVRNVDFLELRACDRSCAGGVLAVANRFLTAERIMKRSMKRDKAPLIYASERLG